MKLTAFARLRAPLAAIALTGTCIPIAAGAEESRISGRISQHSSVIVAGSAHTQIKAAVDQGELPANTPIEAVSLVLKPSAAQQADLDQLLKDQQDAASSHYHQWLTPAEYAQRFGASADDLAAIQSWLTAQGLTVLDVAPNALSIRFSGSVDQIDKAFATQLRQYRVDGVSHYANATDLAVPTELSGMVQGLRNLSDFRARPRLKHPNAAVPQFTSSISGNHYVAPNDFATIYDLAAVYKKGYTGSGQKIAIVGQSAVLTSDIDAFRSAAGLSTNEPVVTLVPNSGTSTTVDGDEEESDLDLEWSGAIAKDATIEFVYTGNSKNYGVFDALIYAIEHDVAPIVSVSYGDCESDYSASDISTFEGYFKQANAQGQTVITASGDEGAADCDYSSTSTVTTATHGLAVDYPASSVYVTSVGGTTFNEGSTTTYWGTSNDSGNGSALSYIPEIAWNDTSTDDGLSASGGGVSTLFAKPSWQVATGVPADGMRDVPDIAFAASPDHDGYLYCSEGSCVSGFRASDQTLTVAGGTSFGAPAFAAVVALLDQASGTTGGLGNVNTKLYTLASGSNTAFHDITGGNNDVPCTVGTPDCTTGTLGYSASTGYDQVTGLGTLDVSELLASLYPATSKHSGGGGAISWIVLTLLAFSALLRRRIVALLAPAVAGVRSTGSRRT
jgi:subtilase family serine protease